MDRRGGYVQPDTADVKKQKSVRRIRTCVQIRLTLLFMIVLPPSDRKDRPNGGIVALRRRPQSSGGA